MKQISNDFKNTLTTFGREYKNKIDVYDNLLLATQSNDLLLTENNNEIIAKTSTSQIALQIDDENIYSIKLITKGEILSTLMKELDFESGLNLDKGSVINYKFGLKIGELSESEANELVSNILTNAMSEFYEQVYYPNYPGDISQYAETGITFSVSSIRSKISNADYEELQKYCDVTTTSIKLYPTSPFAVTDYRLEINITSDYEQYEYIDYGRFIIYNKEFNQDTKNYIYTCYDLMLKTMIMIGDEFTFVGTPTGANMIPKICDLLGIDFDDDTEKSGVPTPYGMIKNLTYNINLNVIKSFKITYRDLLNYLCQYFGVSIYMDNNEMKIKLLGNIVQSSGSYVIDNNNVTIVDTINKDFMKDKNVTFKSIYGKINALTITGTEENNQKYVEDTASVEANGLTLFQIEKNIILSDSTIWDTYGDNIANNIFEMINNVNFELMDITTTGILYLDWLDYYNVTIDNETYKCLLLNSEITIKSGIGENIYTELPEKNVSEYTTSNKSNDIIGDTIRSRGNAYANGERLVQESDLQQFYKEYVLFNDDEGSGDTILLSDNASNYSYFEIYYRVNDGTGFVSSKKIYNPNGKITSLTFERIFSTVMYMKVANIEITNSSILFNSKIEYSFNLGTNNTINGSTNQDNMFITRVAGYKK